MFTTIEPETKSYRRIKTTIVSWQEEHQGDTPRKIRIAEARKDIFGNTALLFGGKNGDGTNGNGKNGNGKNGNGENGKGENGHGENGNGENGNGENGNGENGNGENGNGNNENGNNENGENGVARKGCGEKEKGVVVRDERDERQHRIKIDTCLVWSLVRHLGLLHFGRFNSGRGCRSAALARLPVTSISR